MPELPSITNEDIADALRRSGYLLENRLEDVLREAGFSVEANTSYPDPITQKSRELDLSAMFAEPIVSSYRDIFFSICLIECVNNPYPLAFLTKKPLAPTAHVYDIFISGLPAHVRQKNEKRIIWTRWTRIADFLRAENFHHYCDGRIATQFCSFTAKKGTNPLEWMASHDDGHFNSFVKLCVAVNHDVENHYAHTIPVLNDRINLEIFYPMVVVGGQLLDVTNSGDAIDIQPTDHIHYIQSFVGKDGRERRYHIDVVTEAYFPKMLSIITKETKMFAKTAKSQRKKLYASIDMMAKAAKKYPEQLQTIIRPRYL